MSNKFLRRYTDIPALLYLLTNRKISMLDPQTWDDSNDSHYISVYKDKNQLKAVLALCFSQEKETYHHWKVFAGTSSGICIRFMRDGLLDILTKRQGIRAKDIDYFTLNNIRNKTIKTEDLPFIKRSAFQDEDEFRVIYESETKEYSSLDIPIPLSCIARITLSPWMHKKLASSVKKLIKTIDECQNLKVVRSTLTGNEEWKIIGGKVA